MKFESRKSSPRWCLPTYTITDTNPSVKTAILNAIASVTRETPFTAPNGTISGSAKKTDIPKIKMAISAIPGVSDPGMPPAPAPVPVPVQAPTLTPGPDTDAGISYSKTGTKTYKIIGVSDADNLVDKIYNNITTYTAKNIGGGVVTGEGSRSDRVLIEALVEQMKISAKKTTRRSVGSSSRFLVDAEKTKIGQTVFGETVTGLGRAWESNPDQLEANGIGPWVDWVCYAYCS